MNYSNRFFLYAPVGLFLAIACAVGIHWWVLASRLGSWLDAHNGREVAPGVTMAFASRSITGFPFSLDTVFRGLSIRVDTPHGPTQWRPEEFAMHALTYGRDEIIFEAAGKQDLSWTKADGSKRDLVFAVGSLHASAIRDATGLARFDLDIVGFNSQPLIAKRVQFHTRRDKVDKFELAVTADDLIFPSNSALSVAITSRVDAAHALDAAREGKERWYTGLEHWRLATGKVYLTNLSEEFCGVKYFGRGKLWLNNLHRIDGTLPLYAAGPLRISPGCHTTSKLHYEIVVDINKPAAIGPFHPNFAKIGPLY